MIQRTREVAAGVLRPQVSSSKAELGALPNLAKMPTVSKSMESQKDELRRNSQKYEDLLKKQRDELKRKRGALELNSDLDLGATDQE